MSLDYRTQADIEYGRPGPNLKIPLMISSIIAAVLPLLALGPTVTALLWAAITALLSFCSGYLFLAWSRDRGIPRIMIGPTSFAGSFLLPMTMAELILVCAISFQ